MKIPKRIHTSGWFKAVFGTDSFAAFVFTETFRDIVYVVLKVENLLLRRRVLRLERRIRSLQINQFVPVTHPIEKTMREQCSERSGDNSRSVKCRIDGQGVEPVVTMAARFIVERLR